MFGDTRCVNEVRHSKLKLILEFLQPSNSPTLTASYSDSVCTEAELIAKRLIWQRHLSCTPLASMKHDKLLTLIPACIMYSVCCRVSEPLTFKALVGYDSDHEETID